MAKPKATKTTKPTKPNVSKTKTTKKAAPTKAKPKTARSTSRKKPVTVQQIPPKSKAEEICENVNPAIQSQAVTLTNAVLAMQEKIEQQIPIYKQMPLAQQVTVGTGEKMLRQNPATQEFRATVRDYASALNCLEDILDTQKPVTEVSTIDDLRKRFKIG